MQIGPHKLDNNLILAPMAGVTDLPFRRLCRSFGAGLAVSEMVTTDASLRGSRKTVLRLDHSNEPGPVSVQIVGTEPRQMAEAARINVDHGAQIIDINMGCPAKKVCRVAAGSALMRDEQRVSEILQAVVRAVEVPVTLKMRTGWDPYHKNAPHIARIAEDCGIQAIAVHGRTRACGYAGEAEHETVAEISQCLQIPVIANGDIDSPEKAQRVLETTGASGVMIGRAAQGRPWIFQEISSYLNSGMPFSPPSLVEIKKILLKHLDNLYGFYGEYLGLRIARKHIGWYLKAQPGSSDFRKTINQADSTQLQFSLLTAYFDSLQPTGGAHGARGI